MMKFFPSVVADVAVFLFLSAAVFAQQYKQINLDANVSGVAEAADSQLVNAWGLARSSGSGATSNSYDPDEAPAAELYFTAGPNQGTGGLFGYLIPVSTELIQGNSQ